MGSETKCKECGTAIPAGSPAGLCGRCLFGLGLEQPPQLAPDAATSEVAAASSLQGGQQAEGSAQLPPAASDASKAEIPFERRWAFAILEQTLATLRQEYAQRDKIGLFEEMKGFLPGGDGGASRSELAAKHGISVGAVDVAIHRLRQRFGALLREQVAQTVSSVDEVEEEIRYLISVLGS